MGCDAMRDRFWLVLGVLLAAVIVSFGTIGSRGASQHGLIVGLADQVAELPGQVIAELRDMTRNLVDAMGGAQSSPTVAAADEPATKPPDPVKQ
jgi:uncharacterized coiled-coil protein SlyX